MSKNQPEGENRITMQGHDYEVIVGNIGTVYEGTDETEANRLHDIYVRQSQGGMGRAAGATVMIMRDGTLYMETES